MKESPRYYMKNILCLALLMVTLAPISQAVDFSTLPTPPKTDWEKMWEIQLVNNDNLIPKDVNISFATFNGEKVDARTADLYQAMYDHAKRDGITLYLRSGYRSITTQKYVYDAGVKRYMSYGYNYATAISIANRYYATPGGSEHNIGLAFDIITPEYHNTTYNLNDSFAQTKAYSWLMANCADYGFILRYPNGRTSETGINFEPWHYRYVGVEHAQYIMKHGLILEEYVPLYKATYPELYGDTPPEPDIPLTLLDPDLTFFLPPKPEPEPDRSDYLDYLAEEFYDYTHLIFLSQFFW